MSATTCKRSSIGNEGDFHTMNQPVDVDDARKSRRVVVMPTSTMQDTLHVLQSQARHYHRKSGLEESSLIHRPDKP